MAAPRKPKTISTDVTLTRGPYHDRPLVFDIASGATVTLPTSAGTGDVYRFIVHTTVTTNDDIIQVANATDVMAGNILIAQDAADTAVMFEAASTSDTITLNGTTSGGLRGDWLELVDYKAGFWHVRGILAATGTEETPFSAAVS
jgi:hypothetical protein